LEILATSIGDGNATVGMTSILLIDFPGVIPKNPELGGRVFGFLDYICASNGAASVEAHGHSRSEAAA